MAALNERSVQKRVWDENYRIYGIQKESGSFGTR
jgi:hypothetical protein